MDAREAVPDIAGGRRRALATQLTLSLHVVASLLIFLAFLAQWRMVSGVADGSFISHEQGATNDARIALLGRVRVLMYVLTAVTWPVWEWRAYRNLAAVGSRSTDLSAGWAAGYWFVPFVNLYRPYMVMKELWARSAQANRADFTRNQPPATLLGFWFLCWIGNNVFLRFASFMAHDAKGIDELLFSTKVSIASEAFSVVAAVLAILVVRRVQQYQDSWNLSGGLAAPA